jgi:hypothetical protein
MAWRACHGLNIVCRRAPQACKPSLLQFHVSCSAAIHSAGRFLCIPVESRSRPTTHCRICMMGNGWKPTQILVTWHCPIIWRHPSAHSATVAICSRVCMLANSQRHTIANTVEGNSSNLRSAGGRSASAGIMLARHPVELINQLSIVVLVVILARAAPLDAASAQRGDLVYIEQADTAAGTSTLTVRLYQPLLLHTNIHLLCLHGRSSCKIYLSMV